MQSQEFGEGSGTPRIGGHVCRWRGEDFMAVVVQDELVLEIPGPWWRSTWRCNPGVATLVVLEVLFALADDLFIGPAIGMKGIAVKAFCPLLFALAVCDKPGFMS